MNTIIRQASVQFIPRVLCMPLHLSSGVIDTVTEARAAVTVYANGREVTGHGAIYLSGQWAWPDAPITYAERDMALQSTCRTIADRLPELCGGEAVHPLELGLRLHEAMLRMAEAPPPLARMMCASPFDAALHDAAGIALGCSAFDLYRTPVAIPSADGLFTGGSAGSAIARMLQPPQLYLDAWLIISPHDVLGDVMLPAVQRHGYRCFKLKIFGNPNEDAARTVEVYRAARNAGIACPRLNVDSNEGNPDADSVLEYLHRLQALDAEAFHALAYLEQPTHRDIQRHRYDWRRVAAVKPVMIDEGLLDASMFSEAVAQGWSGFCLKTCKGHSFSLVAAAWAQEHRLHIAMQDLTNPGLAAIHAAQFAARIPTMNGVELNSPQYTPAANADWLPRLAGLFCPRNGQHHLVGLSSSGLGSEL